VVLSNIESRPVIYMTTESLQSKVELASVNLLNIMIIVKLKKLTALRRRGNLWDAVAVRVGIKDAN